ncbi:DUF2802 domain-containing protein [Aestuariibacter sp. A3R04]|uniref:DUF2802 domain-containing protein n=1 Tax=Aestuariibacter sp. A3R04 TaxID=2841571 RepID=UPI001C09568C|nr:DUF2802 domain-containing protein [Aestuariibacter sp. A3R04]MBU3022232.1 DUF2802 domain-containing protein [Aestuariibacter sp. A3R04]
MDASALSLLAIATGLLAVVAVLWLYFYSRQEQVAIRREVTELHALLGDFRNEINTLENQLTEMQTRSMVQAKHMHNLSEQYTQVENQLREVKTQDPSMRLYSRAAELVKSGADVEEIMQACDLPLAEAELLISMHRTR